MFENIVNIIVTVVTRQGTWRITSETSVRFLVPFSTKSSYKIILENANSSNYSALNFIFLGYIYCSGHSRDNLLKFR